MIQGNGLQIKAVTVSLRRKFWRCWSAADNNY